MEQQPVQPGQHQTMPPLAYHPQQGGRGANGPHAYVVGMPPPMGYYNPYAQHPQYSPQVSAGRGGTRGWNPSYPGAPVPVPVGGNPYAQSAGPQQYYQQQGGAGRGGGSIAGRGVPRGGSQGGAGRGTSSYTPPAPRVKKVSVITDKDGNPIDFSSSSKKSSLATAVAAVATSTSVVAATKTESSSSNAGAKLRQAALDAIQGRADKESVKRKAEEEAAAIAAEMKVKEEATAAAAKKKEEEEEEQAGAKKKAE